MLGFEVPLGKPFLFELYNEFCSVDFTAELVIEGIGSGGGNAASRAGVIALEVPLGKPSLARSINDFAPSISRPR